MKRLVILIIIALVVANAVRHSRWARGGPPPHDGPAVIVVDHDGNMLSVGPDGRYLGKVGKRSKPRPDLGRAWAQRDSGPPSASAPPSPPASSVPLADSPASAEPEAAPAWFQHDEPDRAKPGDVVAFRTLKGAQSATEKRADASARVQLERAVNDWLAPDVPRWWKTPGHAIDALVLDRHVEPVNHDYGTLYVTGYRADFSPGRRAQIVDAYQHEVVIHRLFTLGGGLAFVLVCLATLTGYIRADEATKGYYTNRLRVAAGVAVGAAGMALYRVIA